MLSSHLPGQEAGNVPFVVSSGFGEFSKQPKVIAATVSSWLQARRPPRVCTRAPHAANPRTHPVQLPFVQRPPRDDCDPAAS